MAKLSSKIILSMISFFVCFSFCSCDSNYSDYQDALGEKTEY
jgi:hypothetical protein